MKIFTLEEIEKLIKRKGYKVADIGFCNNIFYVIAIKGHSAFAIEVYLDNETASLQLLSTFTVYDERDITSWFF